MRLLGRRAHPLPLAPRDRAAAARRGRAQRSCSPPRPPGTPGPLSRRPRRRRPAQAAIEAEQPEIAPGGLRAAAPTPRLPRPRRHRSDCERPLVPGPGYYLATAQPRRAAASTSRATASARHDPRRRCWSSPAAPSPGADWASGSMSNQLLFEPRRARIWAAKASRSRSARSWSRSWRSAAFWVPLAAGRRRPRTSRSRRASDPRRSWHVAARRGARRLGAALGGYALTMLFRHTVATLGAAFRGQHRRRDRGHLLPVRGAGRWSAGQQRVRLAGTAYHYFDREHPAAPGRRACSSTADDEPPRGRAASSASLLVVVGRRLAGVVPAPRRVTRRDVHGPSAGSR